MCADAQYHPKANSVAELETLTATLLLRIKHILAIMPVRGGAIEGRKLWFGCVFFCALCRVRPLHLGTSDNTMLIRYFCLSLMALLLTGCGESISPNAPSRILLVGDSMLAAHKLSDRSVSHVMEQSLGEPVVDRSVSGARFFYPLPISGAAGMNISQQYIPGRWDWVVVNGGGNDLWLGCGCILCNGKMDRLISEDGRRGKIPGFLSDLRQSGAQVIYVGYMRSPGTGSPIEHCKDEGDELDERISKLAELDQGVHFLSLQEMVPYGDRSYHGLDMIHPSIKGSSKIGQMIAKIINN